MTDKDIHIEYIGGNCPVRSEGYIGGKPFYFRARGQSWSLGIGGNDPVCEPEWQKSGPWGETEYSAGWMPQYTALAIIAEVFRQYCEAPND